MATPIPPNRATVSGGAAASATRGTLLGDAARRHTGLTTDTRAVSPGCVFVALRGEKHDGHAFVGAACERGATLVVVERGRGAGVSAGVDVLEVGDTLVAWGDLAAAHLAAWRARGERRVVAVTGSVGKTTTKELVAALLAGAMGTTADGSGAVRKTDGNLNNRIGVPAMIFTLTDAHRVAVLECGMSLRGEMAELARIVRPDVAVLTLVGLAHAENVGGTREGVAAEKGALFSGSASDATLVVDAADSLAFGMATAAQRGTARRIVSFGTSRGDVRLAARTTLGFLGSRVRVAASGAPDVEAVVPLAGEGPAVDFAIALAAASAALARPMAADEVTRGLALVPKMPGRGAVTRRADGAVVIDDTYNASPPSMASALDALAEAAQLEGRRAVVVFGEMRELGPSAAEAHEAVGHKVAASGVAVFVSCGGLMDRAAAVAERAGVTVHVAAGAPAAAAVVRDLVQPTDVVLVKGSRAVQTEHVVEVLLGAVRGTTP